MNLDDVMTTFFRNQAIPIYGFADACGFSNALPGLHPKELMPTCESVIVFGQPYIAHPFQIEPETHIAHESWWQINQQVHNQIAAYRGELVNLLDQHGLGVFNYGSFNLTTTPAFSYREAQAEAGVGVYGRNGVSIHPEFGCYYTVGVLLTEAELTASDRTHLDDFEPCAGCNQCAEICPVSAIDDSKPPGLGYDRELCIYFLMKKKEQYGHEVKFCSHCFRSCPWSLDKMDGVLR